MAERFQQRLLKQTKSVNVLGVVPVGELMFAGARLAEDGTSRQALAGLNEHLRGGNGAVLIEHWNYWDGFLNMVVVVQGLSNLEGLVAAYAAYLDVDWRTKGVWSDIKNQLQQVDGFHLCAVKRSKERVKYADKVPEEGQNETYREKVEEVLGGHDQGWGLVVPPMAGRSPAWTMLPRMNGGVYEDVSRKGVASVHVVCRWEDMRARVHVEGPEALAGVPKKEVVWWMNQHTQKVREQKLLRLAEK